MGIKTGGKPNGIPVPCKKYFPVFSKNTSVSQIFGENSNKISAGGGILGEDE